jgi:hypothetical protein
MSENSSDASFAANVDDTESTEIRYVAFCDILGFSHKIVTNFDGAMKVYRKFGGFLAKTEFTNVEAIMYSDAIVITSASLGPVLSAVQTLWFVAMAHNLMIRGGISKGRYWERRENNHMLIASEALVRAVQLEKLVSFPMVAVADDIEIPDAYWACRFAEGILATPVLHFRDRNIVNPFNQFWFRSAGGRVGQMMEESPNHKDKYLWFLALYDAVWNEKELVPQIVIDRFLRDGILKKN